LAVVSVLLDLARFIYVPFKFLLNKVNMDFQ